MPRGVPAMESGTHGRRLKLRKICTSEQAWTGAEGQQPAQILAERDLGDLAVGEDGQVWISGVRRGQGRLDHALPAASCRNMGNERVGDRRRFSSGR